MAYVPPKASELRSILRFDRRLVADDGAGNKRGDWSSLVNSRRGRLAPVRGGELIIGDRLAGRSYFTLEVRADDATRAIRPKDRAVDITTGDTRIFDIKFAEAMDAKKQWILMQLEATTGEDGRGQ